MKNLQLLFTLCALLLLSAGGVIESREAVADSVGYWGSSSGKVWKSGFGECWRGKNGITDMACDGVVEEAPVSAPAATVWDSDGDGVIDEYDVCWNTPAGVTVESNGCGIDSDGDGVPDHLDQCPETPPGTVVYTDGCAIVIVTLEGVHFNSDSAALTSEAKSILDGALAAIRANPSADLSVEGHTDSRASDSYNLNLSQRRAQAVVDYLVSKGVSASRLNPAGKGESYPIASNDTREGRHQNRRVEVVAR
ncbi:MAG: OmpA family protein [Proteobacteria bacterium]|nr:OmpA family protein [Pseudomonadota bacterium]